MEKETIIKIPEIILKELNQEDDLDEIQILQEWLSESENNRHLYERLRSKENIHAFIKEHAKIDSTEAWDKIESKIDDSGRIRLIVLASLKYAAILLIPLLIAGYLFFQRNSQADSSESFNKLTEQIDKLKESSLIMADGTIIKLSDASSDNSIVEIDGTRITKDTSQILYTNNSRENQRKIQYNSLITPRSKVFTVTLSDGTKVWLNASSAIKYPTQFSMDTRKVFLTGEAYFEVAKDSSMPFIVSTSDMEVEVSGTSFNVMAYPDDNSFETTLVEGAVMVTIAKQNIALAPGHQITFDRNLKNIEEKEVNTELYVSWKSGKYIFDYENLENVITKLSRWYDIDIAYDESIADDLHFSGTLFKYNDIEQTLNIIELATDVKFEIRENVISVSRN